MVIICFLSLFLFHPLPLLLELNLLKYLAKFRLLSLGSHGGSNLLEEFNIRAVLKIIFVL